MFGEKLLAIALPENVSPSDIPIIADLSEQGVYCLKGSSFRNADDRRTITAIPDRYHGSKDAALLIQKVIADNTITLPESCPNTELQAKSEEILQLLQPQSDITGNTTDGSATLGTLAAEYGHSADNTVNPEGSAATDAGQKTDATDISGKDAEALLLKLPVKPKNADANTSVRSFAGRLFHNLSDAAKTSFQNINEMLAAPHESSASVTHTPAVIDTLLNNITSYGGNKISCLLY